MRPGPRTSALLIASAGALGAIVLVRFPPGSTRFYPACPFHAITGLLCPGCGATRALAALLRGEVAAAWHSNALLVLLAPLLLLYAVLLLRNLWRGRPAPFPGVRPAALAALLAAAVLFTIVRNLA